jgi:hypothetical protein
VAGGQRVVFRIWQEEKIMMIRNVIVAVLFAGFALGGLSACEKEGPAEKAGKAIDETASDIAEGASETMETIEKKVEQ